MNIENLNEAINEAERFLEKAKVVREKVKVDNYVFYGCKQTGALKRASMDLSRALSKIRRTG